MKKIIVSLAALAALSTASFAAGNRSWDLRDTEYYNTSGKSDVAATSVTVAQSPLAIEGGNSNFDRLNMNAEKNALNSH